MKAIDQLQQKLGARIGESLGANRQAVPGASRGSAVATPTADSKYQGCSRIKDALAIELERIVADPVQPRKDFDETALEELAASLKSRGQLQPCRVRWDEPLGRWVIIAGERRFRAAGRAGLTTLQCVEARGGQSESEILQDQLVENCLRQDLKPVEQAVAFKRLIEARGWSHRQLASELRVGAGTVAKALALLELPEPVRVQVEQGALAPSVAYEVSKLDHAADQQVVADQVIAAGLSRAEAAEMVNTIKDRRSPTTDKHRRPDPVEIDLGDGVSVLVRYRKPSTVTATQALRKALKVSQESEKERPDQAA